jgi:hypothetical protein
MNFTLAFGIFLGAYLGYRLFMWFARQSAITSAYRNMMHDLLTNEEYQVKGRFD